MKNKFMLGAVSGVSALALAVPILAQVSGAQEPGSAQTSSATPADRIRPPRPDMTQEGVQARIAQDTAFLATIDAMVAVQKSATQVHKEALTAAAAITDDAQRQEAVRAADEAFRAAIDDAIAANPSLKSAMHGGGKGPGFGRRHGPGHGPGASL